MATYACLNPNCSSQGQPHPNCNCYYEGGKVENFCHHRSAHSKGCQYFAEGGSVQMPMVQIYDIRNSEPILGTIAPEEVTKAIASGSFSLPKGDSVPVVAPDGTFGTLSPEEAPEAFRNGYRYQTREDVLQQKYGSTTQQLVTGAEGALEAATFGLSTAAERALGVPAEDIRGRREANPVAHGVGQAAGIVGSAFIPVVGQAKLAHVAGKGASRLINPLSAQSVLTGIAERVAAKTGVAAVEGIGARVAEGAIKGGVEAALFQSGNEISKMLSEDPSQSIGTAVTNIGLAGLIGAGFGGGFGSVSPLWKASKESKLGQFTQDFSSRIQEHLGVARGAAEDAVTAVPGRDPVIFGGLAQTEATSVPTKLSAGQKAADYLLKKGFAKIFGEDLGTAVGAAVGGSLGHPAAGAFIGKKTLTPFFESILPSIIKPILQNGASGEAMKSAMEYGMAVIRGEALISKASKAVFRGGETVLPSNLLPTAAERAKLLLALEETRLNPEPLLQAGGALGTYMPEQAASLAKTAVAATAFLNSQRPAPEKKSPLDADPVVSRAEEAKFENTLNIAQQPLLVLEKVQKGTLGPQDVRTVQALYPALYGKLQQSLTNELIKHSASGNSVPYATRMSLSLFLGQPLDSTMTPPSIQSIQAQFVLPQKGSEGAQGAPRARRSTASLSKGPQRYLTSEQAAQTRRVRPD